MSFSDTNFNGKTILITGGAGFIGSNLAFYFQDNYPRSRIVVFDCFRNEERFTNGNLKSFGHFQNLIGFEGEIICGDINNKKDLELLDNYNFDFIFHQAAISDTRVNDQEIIMKTNVNSFYSFLDLARRNSAPIVYASSAATYGSSSSPQTIGNENPENTYGFSKLIMDQVAITFAKKYPELTITGLRYFNVFGPREYFKNNTASMVVQLGHQILNGNSPRLFEGSDKIMRDFIYIDDVIQANIKACNSNVNGVFNIGSGKPRSFQEIVDILQSELNTSLDTEYFPNPYAGYQMHTQADISSSIEIIDFQPKFTLENGIKAYLPEIVRLYNENS
jgi:ADP-L-glycero-D-manno-heptose 6-epimerase